MNAWPFEDSSRIGQPPWTDGSRSAGVESLPVKKTPLARLVSLERQFSEIERITKLLRKRLDEVAETVRVVADDLRPTEKR